MIYLAGIWLVCCAVFALAIIRIDRVDRELEALRKLVA